MCKLDVENKIFARALALHAAVDACNGALVSDTQDLELQTLLYIYNAHFREENQAQFCSPQETLQAWRLYQAQRKGLPQSQRVSSENFNFELMLLEKK